MTDEWCVLSETRLFKKMLEHKPVGIARHFHFAFLTDYMNNVYEDEDTDFEELLDDESLKIWESRKDMSEISEPLVFSPKYCIRPGVEQIQAKLDELYDMRKVEENEYMPEEFFEQSDFALPSEFSSLIKKRGEQNRNQSCFLTPSSVNRQGGSRRRRRDSGETQSSRSSTPASRDRKKF